MTLYTDISDLYDAGLIEDLYYADDFVLCVLGGKCIAAIIRNKETIAKFECHGAFIVDGKTALSIADNNDLFKAKAISRTEGYQKVILLKENVGSELALLPPMSDQDAEAVTRLKQAYAERHSALIDKYGAEPVFSGRDLNVSTALSVFLTFLGIPFFYLGRPISAIISLIPFILSRITFLLPSYISFFIPALFVCHVCAGAVLLPYLLHKGIIRDGKKRYVLSKRNQQSVIHIINTVKKYNAETAEADSND